MIPSFINEFYHNRMYSDTHSIPGFIWKKGIVDWYDCHKEIVSGRNVGFVLAGNGIFYYA